MMQNTCLKADRGNSVGPLRGPFWGGGSRSDGSLPTSWTSSPSVKAWLDGFAAPAWWRKESFRGFLVPLCGFITAWWRRELFRGCSKMYLKLRVGTHYLCVSATLRQITFRRSSLLGVFCCRAVARLLLLCWGVGWGKKIMHEDFSAAR